MQKHYHEYRAKAVTSMQYCFIQDKSVSESNTNTRDVSSAFECVSNRVDYSGQLGHMCLDSTGQPQ